jgi:hypothetical protein
MREEINLLREQIKAKKDAGDLQEARELQNILRDKVFYETFERYYSPLKFFFIGFSQISRER